MTERILIVDDHPLTRDALAALLAQQGFDVVGEAASGEEAIAEAEGLQPDLVLLDLTMPGMTGLELAGQLRKLQPGIPVFLMTGYTGNLTDEAVRSVGIRQLVAKPLEFRALAELLANALTPTAAVHPPTPLESTPL